MIPGNVPETIPANVLDNLILQMVLVTYSFAVSNFRYHTSNHTRQLILQMVCDNLILQMVFDNLILQMVLVTYSFAVSNYQVHLQYDPQVHLWYVPGASCVRACFTLYNLHIVYFGYYLFIAI